MRVANCLNNDVTSHVRLNRYAAWLLQLGEGRVPTIPIVSYTDAIEIPSFVTVNSKQASILHVYEDLVWC